MTFYGVKLGNRPDPNACSPGRHALRFVNVKHPEQGRHCTRCDYRDMGPSFLLTRPLRKRTVTRVNRR